MDIEIEKIKWVPEIYPRSKWNTETIKRYADAYNSGDQFPPMTLEEGTNRLLDGKHRFEMYKLLEVKIVPVEFKSIPKGMSPKYFAATLSARHGDRLSNSDLKDLAEGEFESNPSLDPTEWGKRLGVSKSTVYRWVSHILERRDADRASKAWRLSKLGWTQEEIGERLKVDQKTISDDLRKNSHLGKIPELLGPSWNDKGIAEVANRMNLNLTDCYAAAMEGMKDQERLERLEIKLQPYDVWYFQGCHDLMGDNYPGRIPGEFICHVLYFFTKPGQLVIDPMAGSGTTLDACLLMDRKARGYDLGSFKERIDIEKYQLNDGWPDRIKKASLIFWDPPYFDKKNKEYPPGSISELMPDDYLQWFDEKFRELYGNVNDKTMLAFLMSDWDPENSKDHGDHPGIWLWNYVSLLQKAGWNIKRHIQVPLSTQQVHPDIVNKFRESKRLARLGRYLLICEK